MKALAFIQRDEAKLFVLSAVALYFELLVIRWTNAYVRNVGFFTNFLVLASFVGLATGLLLARMKPQGIFFFPLVCLAYCGLVFVGRPRLRLRDPSALFWGDDLDRGPGEALPLAPEVFVAAAFVIVAILFAALGQPIGKLFAKLTPLRAYAVNVGGSLAGILLFTLGSFFLATPLVWFGLVFAGIAPFLWSRRAETFVAYAGAVGCLTLVGYMNVGSQWSPYYRTEVLPRLGGGFILAGNGVLGMGLKPFEKKADLYTVLYGEGGFVRPLVFDDVLVIGAGGGNDVDVALHYGVGHVDAVEINPLPLELGRKLHPDRPYASARVATFVDDGRAFLGNSSRLYDLILYALPDSTGVVSSYANMRVESYLFTIEAFRSVRAHLKPAGVFVLYNQYRQLWLVEKLAGMLEAVFGEPAPFLVDKDASVRAILFAGPGVRDLEPKPARYRRAAIAPATDDWPFLYLHRHTVPSIYLRALATIAALSAALVALGAWVAQRTGGRPMRGLRIDWPLFFMGAAFMLLEAKSIVTFGLLFGTTWLTTALVMMGILAMVLGAVYVNHLVQIARIWPWALGLCAALAVVYAAPPEAWVLANPALRYGVGAFCALSPVLFANVIFARLFKTTSDATTSLASNALGAVAGGIAEYSSLVIGYRNLLLIVAGFYAAAFLLNRPALRSA